MTPQAQSHTPGPWLIHKSNMVTIEDSNRQGICQPLHPWTMENDAEFHANARLIAAAPTLLESTELLGGFVVALCEHFDLEDDIILDVTPHNGDAPYKASLCETIRLATAAIARATGKEGA